jgi:hypothetical protein
VLMQSRSSAPPIGWAHPIQDQIANLPMRDKLILGHPLEKHPCAEQLDPGHELTTVINIAVPSRPRARKINAVGNPFSGEAADRGHCRAAVDCVYPNYPRTHDGSTVQISGSFLTLGPIRLAALGRRNVASRSNSSAQKQTDDSQPTGSIPPPGPPSRGRTESSDWI